MPVLSMLLLQDKLAMSGTNFSNLPALMNLRPADTLTTMEVPAGPSATVVDLEQYRTTRGLHPGLPPSVSANKPTSAPSSTATVSARGSSLATLWRRIEGFSKLQPDWFGEGNLLPSNAVICAARSILDELPRHIRLPQATASGDGEIGLTWFNGSDRLDATVSPEGYLSWAMKFRGEFLEGDYVDQDAAGRAVLFAALGNFYE